MRCNVRYFRFTYTRERNLDQGVVFALALNVVDSSSCLMLKMVSKYSKIHYNLRFRENFESRVIFMHFFNRLLV